MDKKNFNGTLHLFSLLVLILPISLAFVSCGEDEKQDESDYVSVVPDKVKTFDCFADSDTLIVHCRTSWTASSVPEWMAVTPSSGLDGDIGGSDAEYFRAFDVGCGGCFFFEWRRNVDACIFFLKKRPGFFKGCIFNQIVLPFPGICFAKECRASGMGDGVADKAIFWGFVCHTLLLSLAYGFI